MSIWNYAVEHVRGEPDAKEQERLAALWLRNCGFDPHHLLKTARAQTNLEKADDWWAAVY